jgi:ElaB/YqjD/DUF883 family membrane-anchored ribosome-binding protein
MGQDEGQVGTAPVNEQRSPEQIRSEIEDTRQDLGETAAALAEKTDVKARARETVGEVRTTVQQNPIPAAAIAAFAGGFLFGRITSRS